MKILLSVKPQYARAILAGTKRVEFRKTRICRPVREGFIYMSKTEKCIVASVIIDKIIEDNPIQLWKQFNHIGGIDKENFFRYFANKDKGYAILFSSVYSLPLSERKKPHYVPQSFCYI